MGGFLSDGFLIGNDWVSLLKVALGILLNKIFKADLEMELTATGNNVFTGFLSVADSSLRVAHLVKNSPLRSRRKPWDQNLRPRKEERDSSKNSNGTKPILPRFGAMDQTTTDQTWSLIPPKPQNPAKMEK